MVENKTNKHAHNTLDSLRAAIVEEFVNMKKTSSPRPAAASGTTSRWSSSLMGAI
ncbi:Hypothetical protein FKW44_017142 [Caligus rogercresseyi]|uniref:Uncharacterized protein n=1 Tax=Caligus rogercresseyi TaxID=217165 RepID=A0A7T8K1W6_CALRO|nr:Hypothetical protein FKW44_017142 [Caligus rogercresseyi]